jgi:Lrp/AsnC family leucine-responsive transcriptional regulator
MPLDATDLEILHLLQENARISNAEISRRIGLAQSAVHVRVRKMEEKGAILGFAALANPRYLGLAQTAFVLVSPASAAEERLLIERFRALPELLEIHRVAESDSGLGYLGLRDERTSVPVESPGASLLLKIRTSDADSLAELLQSTLGSVEGAAHTTLVLTTLKESSRLPLPGRDY